jgi:hypothetical protein
MSDQFLLLVLVLQYDVVVVFGVEIIFMCEGPLHQSANDPEVIGR